jgi:hypothetical protein
MNRLQELAGDLTSAVERRLFAEYGAIFVTRAVSPPGVIFRDAAQVESFQSSLSVSTNDVGEHPMTLQQLALEALLAAVDEARAAGLSISARSADSGARSYDDTVKLWLRNVTRGLDHWVEEGRLQPKKRDKIQRLSPVDQVPVILELEDNERLFFGTFFDRSILSSVAAPGASQHLSLLAFDVKEYQDSGVEQILNARGWYRTVASDLPHFTFLGHAEESLPALGLHRISREYGEENYQFWVPNL